jgi:hypothetical protein
MTKPSAQGGESDCPKAAGPTRRTKLVHWTRLVSPTFPTRWRKKVWSVMSIRSLEPGRDWPQNNKAKVTFYKNLICSVENSRTNMMIFSGMVFCLYNAQSLAVWSIPNIRDFDERGEQPNHDFDDGIRGTVTAPDGAARRTLPGHFSSKKK